MIWHEKVPEPLAMWIMLQNWISYLMSVQTFEMYRKFIYLYWSCDERLGPTSLLPRTSKGFFKWQHIQTIPTSTTFKCFKDVKESQANSRLDLLCTTCTIKRRKTEKSHLNNCLFTLRLRRSREGKKLSL